MGLQEFLLDDPEDFLCPDEVEHFITGLIAKEDLAEGLAVTNMSILCGNGKARAVTHAYSMPLAETPLETERFGIFMLSDGSNRTIYYKDIPAQPTAKGLKRLWHDAPHELVDKLYEAETSRDYLRKYSQPLFASKEKRVEPGVVPQHNMWILNGSHPHCAPAAEGSRDVLFFVLTPLNREAAFDGKEQMSKEKLNMMLYDVLLEAFGSSFTGAERFYLVGKFVTAVVESLGYGADDNTLVMPTDWDWGNIRECLEAAKVNISAAREEAIADGDHADTELQLAIDMMGYDIAVRDYRDR